MHALVVDDSRVARKVLIGVLRHQCGFEELSEAGDGDEALKVLETAKFDLILMDWNMPNMQGIEVLRSLREMGRKVPVIMVSSEKQRAQIVEAIGAGANNYIVKPIVPEVVAEKVKETLDRVAKAAGCERSRRALVADDSGVMRQLLMGVLTKNCGFEEVVQAADGVEAVDLSKKAIYDIILLDWNMPNMLGIEALAAIRENDETTPIVMVTSEKEGARVVEAFDAGATNYILKPFEPASIGDKINQMMVDHF